VNLAFALADAGRTVILLAAEAGKQHLEQYISTRIGVDEGDWQGGGNGRGPADSAEIDNPWLSLWLVSTRVSMVSLPDSPAVLGTARIKGLVDELEKAADFVLVDASPILERSDAWALAPAVDGVLCVTDARRTTRGALEAAMQELHRVGAWVIGVVLNNSGDGGLPARPANGGNPRGHHLGGARPTDQTSRLQP
jgi:Mrp family chromosome partitioning ATPase